MTYDTPAVRMKWECAHLFHDHEDPGNDFEMSEWFEKRHHTPPKGLLLVKNESKEVYKAFHFPGHRVNWCTWKDGYGSSGQEITHWAFFRHLPGEYPKDASDHSQAKYWPKVMNWERIHSKIRMSA